MGRRALALGEVSEIEATPQYRDDEGHWKRHPTGRGRGVQRWRARVYFRGFDGMTGDLSRVAPTKREAIAAAEAALQERDSGDVEMTAGMPLVRAGEVWLAQIRRTDSGLSERTVTDYGRTFARYIDTTDSSLRGLTLAQANDPQRLRRFLQHLADGHGTGAAKMSKSVLSSILGLAVDNGTLPANAMRQVRPVRAQTPRISERDTSRAFTRQERDDVIAHADSLTAGEMLPGTQRKRQATADLVAFMAGTGVRITEARRLRWEHVNLKAGTVDVHGTKSKSALRRLTLPAWLAERLRVRAARVGSAGYVFASPHLSDPERPWDQSNCAKALAGALEGAGHSWATPHTFRRTVATLLHEAGVPIAQIADQLGHADPAMTASVYLGRDFMGERTALAAHL